MPSPSSKCCLLPPDHTFSDTTWCLVLREYQIWLLIKQRKCTPYSTVNTHKCVSGVFACIFLGSFFFTLKNMPPFSSQHGLYVVTFQVLVCLKTSLLHCQYWMWNSKSLTDISRYLYCCWDISCQSLSNLFPWPCLLRFCLDPGVCGVSQWQVLFAFIPTSQVVQFFSLKTIFLSLEKYQPFDQKYWLTTFFL